MKDRIVQHSNRYKLTNVSGDTYELTPEPGVVTEDGTPLNKATLLKDDTAALYGLGADAVPDDVFAAIGVKLPEKARIVTGSYTGTGAYGSSNKNTLTFPAQPQIVFIQGSAYGRDGWGILLIKDSPRANIYIIQSNGGALYLTWSGNSVSWYGGRDNTQFNSAGEVYNYAALCAES